MKFDKRTAQMFQNMVCTYKNPHTHSNAILTSAAVIHQTKHSEECVGEAQRDLPDL